MTRHLRLLSCMVLLGACLPASAQDSIPDPAPPWEAADPEPIRPQVSQDQAQLAQFHRYQRVTFVGTPFYLAGLTMSGWGYYTAFVNDAVALGPALMVLSGSVFAAGGAGAMAWGSHSAAMILHDGAPPPSKILAGRIAYGMLGVGTTGIIASFFLVGVPAGLSTLGGYSLIVLSGIPALVQMSQNRAASRLQRAQVVVLPSRDALVVGLAGRF